MEDDLSQSRSELERRVEERTRELHAVIGVLKTEVAERAQVEEALYKEREFLKVLLENITDGIVACDAEGRLTIFNRATRELHGLPEAPLPPDEWAQHYDLYEPDGVTPLSKEHIPLYRALQGEQVRDAEMVIAPKQGAARTLLSSGRALTDAQGRKIGAVVSYARRDGATKRRRGALRVCA
jgi:PAS domain S-box-containing protein